MNNHHSRSYVHIRKRTNFQRIDIKEILQFRDFFRFLILRDIKVKYKQSILGMLWAIIRPFFMMIIFTLFLGKLAKIPSDGVPYPIFNYTAMVAWTYFSSAITISSNSLVGASSLISKVYFPRLLIPLTPILAGLLDFIIAFIVVIPMMMLYNIHFTVMALILPILFFLMVLAATGVGLIFSALNAKYRDIQNIIPFLTQFWMFASPIVYPASLVPERYRMIYALNPMTGIIEGFRSALLGTIPFPTEMVLLSVAISIMIFLGGVLYFTQVERYLADVI
jgi:lipopolysaccharide transport system permease protein